MIRLILGERLMEKIGIKNRSGIHGTTIICVRHKGRVAIAADGQVTMGNTVMKSNAKKIRKIYNDKIVTGFAGATADALTLFEKFEAKIEEYKGNITRAAVELAKEWRTDRVLRRLEALLIIADKDHSFLMSGTGDVIEPEDGVLAIGSGGPYALSAARALIAHSNLDAPAIAEKAMQIAADIDIYTNREIIIEELKQ